MSDVADAVSVERSALRSVGDVADVVQVVCASAAVAFGVAAGFKQEGLCDVVVLVAVGAGEVVADYACDVFAYFGYGESSYDEAAQSGHVLAVGCYGCDVDGGGVFGGVGEVEFLSVVCDDAVFSHAFAAGKEYGGLQDVVDAEPCGQVAIFVADVAVLAACKQQCDGEEL